jgi:glutamine amidotransferase
MGNLLSVKNAVEYLGFDAALISSASELSGCEKLILPGVGAFPDCMRNLEEKGFVRALNEEVLNKKKPIMGICLGMQVMASLGEEVTRTKGLGWFDAEVVLMQPSDPKCRVPHVGWSETDCQPNFLFKGIKGKPEFYFVHSYYMKCQKASDIAATFDHGGKFTAAVYKDNIVGCQFHPEKSQEHGLIVLQNFIEHSFS